MSRNPLPALLLATAACATGGPPASSPPGPPPAIATITSPPPPAREEPQKPAQFLPATVYSGGDGSSLEQAVVVMADSEPQGVLRENEWIFDHHGRFRKRGVGLATVGQRKYDVVTVELPDHSESQVFFDITSFFGRSGDK
ncbi:MAG: hypothetical protein ACRD16_14105 [Thermoanaerobaculia bacterium]